MQIGFSGIKVWVNEGVQMREHSHPWDDIADDYRRDGMKFSEVLTPTGVAFRTKKGTTIWYPANNLVRVEMSA